jgi:hypothetical protein
MTPRQASKDSQAGKKILQGRQYLQTNAHPLIVKLIEKVLILDKCKLILKFICTLIFKLIVR